MKRADLPGISPKPPRRMLKPRKAALYQRIEQQDGELIRLRGEVDRLVAENESLRLPLWKRITRKAR